MHGSLFAVALLFWTGVLQMRGPGRWQAILGLIITGKLSCLLAALLIFSPRFLYATITMPPPSRISSSRGC